MKPGTFHLYLKHKNTQTLAVAARNGVSKKDLDTAQRALKPLKADDRKKKIHELYVSDARDKGYAEGDPESESTWVLGQRAHAYYDL